MILMTPDGRYDPATAFSILNRFPTLLVAKVVQELRHEGVVSKVRRSASTDIADRRIPGLVYSLSDK